MAFLTGDYMQDGISEYGVPGGWTYFFDCIVVKSNLFIP